MSYVTKTYSPRHRIIVKDLKTGDPLPIGPKDDGDISDDLIGLSTNKAYGRAAGTFQMTLVYREWDGDGGYKVTYSDVILPDCIVTVELDAGDGQGFIPVMLGLVDRTSRTCNASGSLPQRNIRVSGQDVGKLFQTCDIGWDISGAQVQIQTQDEASGTTRIVTSYMKRTLLQTNTAKGLGLAIFDMFRAAVPDNSLLLLFTEETDDDWCVWDTNMQYIANTSAWEAMKRSAHDPWNTLTTETVDINTFEVRLERTPIDANGKLATTTTYEITDNEIIQEDLGFSDAERVNLLCYWPTLYKYSTNDLLDIALADPNLTYFDNVSIKQHGYRRHIIYDNFLPIGAKTTCDLYNNEEPFLNAATRAQIFWNWYNLNHDLESGSIVVHGRPDIRCGHGLLVKQQGGATMEYLIEQVSHQYSMWPIFDFTTTMQVTRGQLRSSQT